MVYFFSNICFFLSFFGCLLTGIFITCLFLTGEFFFVGNDLFFIFTIYKLNPFFIKNLCFIPFFYFYPEDFIFSWFNVQIIVAETFFFNDKTSAFFFIRFTFFAFVFFLVSLVVFSILKFKVNIKFFLFFLFFLVFLYFLYILLLVYLIYPPLYYYQECLVLGRTLPDLFFPDLIWYVPYINRSCVICYREYSSDLRDLVDSIFHIVGFFYFPNGVPWYISRLPEVMDLKRQCIKLLLNQCPISAHHLIIDYAKNFSLASHGLFFLRFS
jgi:hypothetical protein